MNSSARNCRVMVSADGRGLVSQAGPVASDPVVSRLVSTLAADGPRALAAIRAARAAARDRTWTARRWEPKRLRLRVFAVAGRLARSGRRLRLRHAGRWPWAGQIMAAATRLQTLPSG